MGYSTNNLATREDCDVVIDIANKEMRNLVHQQQNLEFQQENYNENTVDLASEQTSLQAQIDAQVIIINGLPDGDAKNKEELKKKKLEYKMLLLNERKANYGAVALLDKELDLKRASSEIKDVQEFIEAVQNRRSQI